MYNVLVALLVLDGILLSIIVLLQAGKGGGLAAMGGGGGGTAADTLIGGRQAATLLTKSTWVAGTVFLVLAMVLSVLSSRAARPESILQQEFQTSPAPEPLLPGTQTQPGAQPETVAPAPTEPATPEGGAAEESPGNETGTNR